MATLEKAINKYKLVDLTHRIEEEAPSYIPYIHAFWEMQHLGDPYNCYTIYIPEHYGTHVDATVHAGGPRRLDDIPLKTWQGPCCLIDLSAKTPGSYVTTDEVKKWEKKHGKIRRDDIPILKYGWEKKWRARSSKRPQFSGSRDYFRNFPGLSVKAAGYIARKGIKLLCTDTPTVDPYPEFAKSQSRQYTEPAHVVLLVKHDIPVLEGLCNLDKIPPRGSYIMAFPLPIKDGTGSPVRAVAYVPR